MAKEKEDEIVKMANMRHSSLSMGRSRPKDQDEEAKPRDVKAYMSPQAQKSARKLSSATRDSQCLKIENRFKSYEKQYGENKSKLSTQMKELEDNQMQSTPQITTKSKKMMINSNAKVEDRLI